MIVDTSAVLAILFDEPDAGRFARALEAAELCRMSAASYLEAGITLERQGPSGAEEIMVRFLARSGIAIEPVTAEHARIAHSAFRSFGKGRHPAALNFGDCFSYALARATDEPLLFKGNDFARTDIVPALG